MKRIHIDKLRPSADWASRAEQAVKDVSKVGAKLSTATEAERPEILKELRAEIAKHSALWAELKDDMAQLSSGKCWYCESRENRSDLAVDHFRPKSKVKECATHQGYWWLAFDPVNYRFACDLCNSLHTNEEADEALGKGTHFPLIDEANRVFVPSGNLDHERPTLLDPALPGDPALLWFQEEGSAVPRYAKKASELFNTRAETSIRVYNLNDVRIREERFAIANEINLQVARGDKYLDAAMDGDAASLELFKEAYRVIQKLIRDDAVFSSAARAVLAGYRDKEWVVSALTTA